MKLKNRTNQQQKIEGATPATLSVAAAFMAFVGYFVVEHYFTANEYYAVTPPYLAILLSGVVGAGLVFAWLRSREPDGANHAVFAALFALGFGMAIYSFLPRLNILTDQDGLHEYNYTLDADYLWQPHDSSLPKLRLYLKSSDWWQQYKPGDSYTFELRKGGLGIWQVNMSRIYDDQKRYYVCGDVISCMAK